MLQLDGLLESPEFLLKLLLGLSSISDTVSINIALGSPIPDVLAL